MEAPPTMQHFPCESVKMAAKFRIGDFVWAKMKGFPAWPGKVIEPKPEVKKPSNKKVHQFVFFYGSENYAWIPEDTMWSYVNNKTKFTLSSRIPRGFKEAIEAIEDIIKTMPATVQAQAMDLPSIDEELAQIFPNRPSGNSPPHRDYSREPLAGARKKNSKPSFPKTKKALLAVQNGTDVSESSSSSASSSSARPASTRVRKVTPKAALLPKPKPKEIPVKKTLLSPKQNTVSQSDKKKAAIKRVLSPPSRTQQTKKARLTVKVPSSPSRVSPSKASPPEATVAKDEPKDVPKPKSKTIEHTSVSPILSNFNPDAAASPKSSSQKISPATAAAASELSTSGTQCEQEILQSTSPGKPVVPTVLRIGFLGLGIMGQGMVMNLLLSGHEVMVWNRTPGKCREFVKDGAYKGNTPAEVVSQCDVTFCCVADPLAAKDVVFGNSGVLQGITAGKGYVDMSTVDVETAEDINEAVRARGGRFLEAPVSGSKVPALEGQLIIMAAGDEELFNDCYTCFEAMGKKAFYLGEIGNGAKMKLVINMVMGTVMATLSEGMALAEKVGLDQEDVAEVLSLSALSCPTVNHKSQAILNQKYDPHFPLQHQQKDLRLALQLGDKVEQPLYVAAAANELYKKARRLGYGESDISAVFRAASA